MPGCWRPASKRPAPLCDDKVLTGWNGLMIAAYADGYRVLRVDKYRQAAEKARRLSARQAALARRPPVAHLSPGAGQAAAYLEDYAFLAHGLIRLHAATGDARWLQEARTLTDRMIADFEDREEGGFFFTATGHESLLARAKDPFDNALPSGNSMAILDLMALYRATGEASYRDHAGQGSGCLQHVAGAARRAMPMMVVGLEQYLDQRPECDRTRAAPIARRPIPAKPGSGHAPRPGPGRCDRLRAGVRRRDLGHDPGWLAHLRQSDRASSS